LWLVGELARGRRAAQLLGGAERQTALLALLLLLLALGVAALWSARERARRNARWALGLALAAFGAAVLAFAADALVYRGLYHYLHGLLGAAAVSSAVLGSRALDARWPARERVSLLPLALVVVVGITGVVASRRLIGADGAVRHAARDLTTLTSKLLALQPAVSRRSARPVTRAERAATRTTAHDEAIASAPLRGAHVLLVTVDALRADRVDRRRMPNVVALSRRAARFTRASCQAPLTCYSLPSLHSGDYLMSSLPLRRRRPPTLAEVLRAAGYTTKAFFNRSVFFCDDPRATRYGKQHFGFERAATALRPADVLARDAARFITQHASRAKRQPLFLWVHFFDVHEPYTRHAEHDFGRSAEQRYDSEAAFVDAAIGKLLRAARALRGRRIVVLTSDHGEAFGEHGNRYHGSSLYQEQVHVPLIIAAPGIAPLSIDAPAQLVDIAPTVAELVGVARPPTFLGRSWARLLVRREPLAAPAVAVSELERSRMVSDGRFKLIVDRARDTEQLYDLARDPHERDNVVSRRPLAAARLRGELSRWLDELRRSVRAHNAARHDPTPAALARARLGDRRAVPALLRLLADRSASPRHRRGAVRVLGTLRDHRAIAPLRRLLASADDASLSREAAIALGELEHAAVWPLLLRALDDPRDGVRLRAAIALARLRHWPRARAVAAAATPALVEGLVHHDWQLARRAVHYLGQVGDRRAIGPAIAALRMQHLRRDLALALGRLYQRFPADARLGVALARLCRDDKADVRAAARRALRRQQSAHDSPRTTAPRPAN
ncbi:MAG: sulfatase-like hydrolase/transferase, partial [Myxococcales bacterium]|nr:sulfatase-like hydrolase/transferase [Myxococcales bacterium]